MKSLLYIPQNDDEIDAYLDTIELVIQDLESIPAEQAVDLHEGAAVIPYFVIKKIYDKYRKRIHGVRINSMITSALRETRIDVSIGTSADVSMTARCKNHQDIIIGLTKAMELWKSERFKFSKRRRAELSAKADKLELVAALRKIHADGVRTLGERTPAVQREDLERFIAAYLDFANPYGGE